MSRIEVISSSMVGRSSNATSMSRLDLTAYDVRLLLLDPIQRALLFHKPPHNFIPHLKTSLSRALDLFPPLAGHLVSTDNDDGTTSYFVDCNNAGVEFTHAVAASVSISDILDSKYVPEIVSSFFVLNGTPNYEGVSKPLLGVQVTELSDGLIIACTANHVVVDGISFWHFINSWSELARGFDTISRSPVFQRWFPNEDSRPIRLPPFQKNLWRNFVPPPVLERVFHFSKECLTKLKAKANSEAETDRISSLQALSAHLWRCNARCSRRSWSGGEIRMCMLVGARPRIPLADGYFGNAVYGAITAMSEDELLQNGLGCTALKIHEIVGAPTKEMAVKLVEDWMRNPRISGTGGASLLSSPVHLYTMCMGMILGGGNPLL